MSAHVQESPASHDAEQAVVNMRRSLATLANAASALNVPVTPQMASGVQATENAWRRIESEFGLLSPGDVADLMGSKSRTRTSYAADKRRSGQLLGIKRRNSFAYPGFQFDRATGGILPVIVELIAIANRHGKSHEGMTQWLCAPTGQLDDQRPVDHLHEPTRVVEAAENHFGVRW